FPVFAESQTSNTRCVVPAENLLYGSRNAVKLYQIVVTACRKRLTIGVKSDLLHRSRMSLDGKNRRTRNISLPESSHAVFARGGDPSSVGAVREPADANGMGDGVSPRGTFTGK